MPLLNNPIEWVQSAANHVRQTGHSLLNDDSILRDTFGFTCIDCGATWILPVYRVRHFDPKTAEDQACWNVLGSSLMDAPGRTRVLELVNQGQRPSPLLAPNVDARLPVMLRAEDIRVPGKRPEERVSTRHRRTRYEREDPV